jgi:hypothetical protein
MEFIRELQLMETQKRANKEIGYAINAINEIYREWKKLHRRRNAVNIVTTSVNRISHINPATVDHIHDTGKTKLAVIIMRCMDIPPWMDVEAKRITYRRLYPLIAKLENICPQTGTDGTLREILMTRLSASVCNNCGDEKRAGVFVAYEPKIPESYARYIFGDHMPNKITKMQTLSLPKDFDTLIDTLKINHDKACDKYL